MPLKVIRYKNYGCTMTSEDDEDKFYSSFFELNNGEIIELLLFQNKDHKDYDFNYAKTKFKSGKIRAFTFGNAKADNEEEMSKEFFDWFNFFPNRKDVIDSYSLYEGEEKCVKDFYLKYIEPTKHIKTDTIEVKP